MAVKWIKKLGMKQTTCSTRISHGVIWYDMRWNALFVCYNHTHMCVILNLIKLITRAKYQTKTKLDLISKIKSHNFFAPAFCSLLFHNLLHSRQEGTAPTTTTTITEE